MVYRLFCRSCQLMRSNWCIWHHAL